MVVTSRVRLDRISSSTRNAALPPEVIVGLLDRGEVRVVLRFVG